MDTTNTSKTQAAEIRHNLRAAFPGVKFSVRMARGTGYGWIDIRWTDGPYAEAVRAIAQKTRTGEFSVHRAYSEAAQDWAAVVATPGTRWWRDDDAPYTSDPVYYAVQELLAGLDLTHGLPDDPRHAWLANYDRRAI